MHGEPRRSFRLLGHNVDQEDFCSSLLIDVAFTFTSLTLHERHKISIYFLCYGLFS